MKSVAKFVRSFRVETPVLSVMFIAYFILLAASAAMILNQSSDSTQTVEVKEIGAEAPAGYQIKN